MKLRRFKAVFSLSFLCWLSWSSYPPTLKAVNLLLVTLYDPSKVPTAKEFLTSLLILFGDGLLYSVFQFAFWSKMTPLDLILLFLSLCSMSNFCVLDRIRYSFICCNRLISFCWVLTCTSNSWILSFNRFTYSLSLSQNVDLRINIISIYFISDLSVMKICSLQFLSIVFLIFRFRVVLSDLSVPTTERQCGFFESSGFSIQIKKYEKMKKYKIIGGFKLKTSLSPKKLDSLNSTQQSFYEQTLVNLYKHNQANQSSLQKISPPQKSQSIKRDSNQFIQSKVRKIQVSRPCTSFLKKKRCVSPTEKQFDDSHLNSDNDMADLIQKFTIRSQQLRKKIQSRENSPNHEKDSTQKLENIAERLLNPRKKKHKEKTAKQVEQKQQQQSPSQSKFIFNRRRETVQDTEMNRYQLLNTIGTGSYARVRLARDKMNNEEVAIKTYSKARMTNAAKKLNLIREINILKRLKHWGIVKLLNTVETMDEFHLVQEYGGSTNLRQHLQQKRRLVEEEVKEIMRQVAEAIEYCHSNNVIHRDIKLENILIEGKKIKIIDFGFSVYIPKNQKITSYCGTPTYMAPEILKKEEYHARPIDMWAIGVLLYVLVSNRFPFKGSSDEELNAAIIRGKYAQVNASLNCQKLVGALLEYAPEKRMSSAEMLRHDWFE